MIADPVLRLWLMGLLVMIVMPFVAKDSTARAIVWAAGFIVMAAVSFVEALKR